MRSCLLSAQVCCARRAYPGWRWQRPHPLAIEASEAALRQGANALEAAVVASAVLGVVEPYASGVGGGGFLLLESPSAEVALVMNFRVLAPAAASARMFRGLDPEEVESSGLAVGVPGTPLCWRRALDLSREHLRGRMTLTEAMQPAIRLAREGFPINDTFVASVEQHKERLAENAEARRLFVDPGYREGDIATNPDLAATLESLESTFYRGRMAATIIESILDTGGRVVAEDLPVLRCAPPRSVAGQLSRPPCDSRTRAGQRVCAVGTAGIYTRAFPSACETTGGWTAIRCMRRWNA